MTVVTTSMAASAAILTITAVRFAPRFTYGTFVGTVDIQSRDWSSWTLDTLVTVNDALSRFYTPEDVKERVQRTTSAIGFSVPFARLLV